MGARLLVVGAVAALGCNKQGGDSGGPTSAAPTANAFAAPLASSFSPQSREGVQAPDVILTLQDGFALHILSEKGKIVTVFFCSQESSVDCAREMKAFRDAWSDLHTRHVVVVGVSSSDPAAHRALVEQQNLPFDLATDVDGTAARAFELESEGDYGVRTFVISRDGKILRTWAEPISPSHVREVLAFASSSPTEGVK